MPDPEGKRLPFKEEFNQQLKKTGDTSEAFYEAVEAIRDAGKAVKAGMEKRVAEHLDTLRKIAAVDEPVIEGERERERERDEIIEEFLIPEEHIIAAMSVGWSFEQIERFAETNPERAVQILTRIYENQNPKIETVK